MTGFHPELHRIVAGRTLDTFQRAHDTARNIALEATESLRSSLATFEVEPDHVCFVAVGSLGRGEIGSASDVDLLPVAISASAKDVLVAHNDSIRAALSSAIGRDVSSGRAGGLMAPVLLGDLTDLNHIGGNGDTRQYLTQRVLILAESIQVGGALPIGNVRKAILEAYSQEATSGRHPLAVCNDLARYYRTVCVDYKGRADTTDPDGWCLTNVKLRHGRKFWYFATMLGIASIADRTRPDSADFIPKLLVAFDRLSVDRLLHAVDRDALMAAGRLLDQYAWYLEFMDDPERRKALSKVAHEQRYSIDINNPFPSLQWSSKIVHSEMIQILDRVSEETRARMYDWFLV